MKTELKIEKDDEVSEHSHEDTASTISYYTQSYLNALFDKGNKQTIELKDLGIVSKQDRSDLVYVLFEKFWNIEMKLPSPKRRLWRALWKTVGWGEITKSIVLYAMCSAGNFGPPMILNFLVKHFEGSVILSDEMLGLYVSLMLVIPVVGAVVAAQSNSILAHSGIQFRNALVTMIYRKSLRLSSASSQLSSTGKIVTMFSIDTMQMQKFLPFLGYLILAPPTVGVALYLICELVGIIPTFAGLALILLVVPLNAYVFKILGDYRKKKVQQDICCCYH